MCSVGGCPGGGCYWGKGNPEKASCRRQFQFPTYTLWVGVASSSTYQRLGVARLLPRRPETGFQMESSVVPGQP